MWSRHRVWLVEISSNTRRSPVLAATNQKQPFAKMYCLRQSVEHNKGDILAILVDGARIEGHLYRVIDIIHTYIYICIYIYNIRSVYRHNNYKRI